MGATSRIHRATGYQTSASEFSVGVAASGTRDIEGPVRGGGYITLAAANQGTTRYFR
jgi:hypothetical protein